MAFLSYFFPPLGGGGTPRSVKFCKFLPRLGWRPVVFTGATPPQAGNREFNRDESQSGDLQELETRVIRVDESPTAILGAARRSPGWPFFWAAAYPWVWEAQLAWARRLVPAIAAEHRRSPFDVIYASAAPYSTIWAAFRASRRLGIPYVADLRDLWTRDTLKFFPSRLHYWWESRLERRLLRNADAIVANTPGSAKRLCEWLGPCVADKITVIPNGFDEDERLDAPTTHARPDGTRVITLLHAGTLYAPGQRSSRLGRYRPTTLQDETRSVVPLAQGLQHLFRTDPDLARRIRIRLVGYTPPELWNRLESLGIAASFSLEGVVPRSEALAAMRDADALLVLQVSFSDPARRVPYVPGKVYEYLATRKPILAPVPPGDLHDLLAPMPQAFVCDCNDPVAITATLQRLVTTLSLGPVPVDEAQLSQYCRRSQALRLARVFDEVTS